MSGARVHTELSNSTFSLTHDSFGRLILITAEGERYVGVEPVRSFPFTDPRKFISVRRSDGREVAFIADLDTLPDATRTALEAELKQVEFIPVIERIHTIKGATGPMHWDVETDRGRTQFVMNNEDDIRRLSYNTLILVDAAGARYFIPNVAALDTHSRRLVEWAM